MNQYTPAAGTAPQNERQSETPDLRREQDAMAGEIAAAFNDNDHLATYQAYCRNYPIDQIKRAFNRVRAVPASKVRRSRLALFIYLVKSDARKEK